MIVTATYETNKAFSLAGLNLRPPFIKRLARRRQDCVDPRNSRSHDEGTRIATEN